LQLRKSRHYKAIVQIHTIMTKMKKVKVGIRRIISSMEKIKEVMLRKAIRRLRWISDHIIFLCSYIKSTSFNISDN